MSARSTASYANLMRLRACIAKAAQICDLDESERNRVTLFCRETGAVVSDAGNTFTLRCCGVSTSSTSNQIKLFSWLERAREKFRRIA
jgi:hypothetical protein